MRYFQEQKLRFLALFAGILLPLSFTPFDLTWMAIISPAILLSLWYGTNPREAFRRGWFYGLGFFGVGVSWIYVSIHEYGNTDIFLATVLTFIFVAFLSLFPAIQGYFLQKVMPDSKLSIKFFSKSIHLIDNQYMKALIYFPISWVLIEWTRTWILTGFPWLQLGHSQVDSLLSGYIPVFGVFGVTALVALLSGFLYLLIIFSYQKTKPITVFLTLSLVVVFILSLGAYLKTIQWTVAGSAIRVALVQGNIPQKIKWSPDAVKNILRWYPKLSQSFWKENDLVVWPEGAVTLPLPWSTFYLNQLLKMIKPYPVSLIMGLPALANNSTQYYNALILMGGTGVDIYYKRYLVPFGEFLPLEQYLRGLINFFDLPMSDFVPGSVRGDNTLQNQPKLSIAPFVCYEIAYPEAILTTVPKSNLMVLLSNDTWFGNSLGPYQHLQIARFAALVSGRYLLASTNDGITAIIDSKGNITARAPRFKAVVLQGRAYLTNGNTPWVAWTHRYILICLGLIMFVARIGTLRKSDSNSR